MRLRFINAKPFYFGIINAKLSAVTMAAVAGDLDNILVRRLFAVVAAKIAVIAYRAATRCVPAFFTV